ncbi:hypothetical protein [Aurantimonas endophytica]|uniref:Uncharacterized protein n=1 Tax=Aurantimonas endophytica TaxID=1522175 RepID=A0A7W6MPQ9_9HYPH|nr:hypothetical protein [Aurantimonas endophytica]MBB4003169.1 hypothetical protein [Aurantimonas endophytica]MCO6404040.1 hypothetical protein [Aurantimonas endophytica]
MSALTVGGSTGIDYRSIAAIDAAAKWLAAQKEAPHPLVHCLWQQIARHSQDAWIAAREAASLRSRRL